MRALLNGNLLERDWWHTAALDKLGPMHPAVQSTQGTPPSRDTLRVALRRYASASTQMQAGIYDRKVARLSLGEEPHLKVSPDGTKLSAYSGICLQVYDSASFELLSQIHGDRLAIYACLRIFC
ncbi:hypothetical protein WJX73_007292 [Symbiochloris irregularis]|uniref:Uncharacterized protein n=1 Tax=Symbiochloris irregularis TaxID=706552 RepID=A0AAW1NNP8_9CHLO